MSLVISDFLNIDPNYVFFFAFFCMQNLGKRNWIFKAIKYRFQMNFKTKSELEVDILQDELVISICGQYVLIHA